MDAVAGLMRSLEPDMVRLRRELHQAPELAFEESATGDRLTEQLAGLGLVVRRGVGGSGLVADFDGAAPGPRLLIRAEMDALPISEATGLRFASATRGVMHACGHDAHMAAVVGAARALVELRDQLVGSIRFCFQPAEEILSGAEAMIRDGVLDGVDRVLGGHVLSGVPVGTVLNVPGPVLAGADFFEISVTGRAGHAGMPESTVDPVLAAAHVVSALQAIVARETRPGERLVIGIAAINGGNAANVATDTVRLRGNVRWFSEETRERALERIQAVAAAVCAALRASSAFMVIASAPVSINSAAELDVVRAATAATGRAISIDSGPITASDDWARLSELRPGAFFHVGAGGPAAPPHHHPAFDIDESAIGLMSEVLVRTALAHLTPPGPGNDHGHGVS